MAINMCKMCFVPLNRLANVRYLNLSAQIKRRKPVDGELEKEKPVFEYPHGKPSDRRVYACGLLGSGALGVHLAWKKKGKVSPYSRYPTRVSFAEEHDVTNITAGVGFSVFSIKTKEPAKVFGTGLNTDSQIGYHAPRRENPLQILLRPVPIFLPLRSPRVTKILALSAGRAHTVIVTDNEGVFCLGNNAFGQCGRRIISSEKYFGSMIVHNIPEVGNEKIIDAECGQDHSMLLTESGKVYSFGWGSDGQTALGHYNNEWLPGVAKGDIVSEKIVKLSCKADCVLALNDKGEVFGWGNNEYGQLPIGSDGSQQVCLPTYVKATRKLGKIIDIASAGTSCLIVNDCGEVFVWGFGLLGKGPTVMQSSEPTQIPQTLFGKNDFNPDVKVVKVACGLNYMAAITNAGDLFTWGRNMNGCLGLGDLNDHFFPLKTAVGAEVLDVSCGYDHMLILARPFA